jgi:hypothetical protein
MQSIESTRQVGANSALGEDSMSVCVCVCLCVCVCVCISVHGHHQQHPWSSTLISTSGEKSHEHTAPPAWSLWSNTVNSG